MRLKTLVVLVILTHSCIDALGLVIYLLWPIPPLPPERPLVYEDTVLLTNKTRSLIDYSETSRLQPFLYVVPHLWSGVIPRMLEGYSCVVADQEVSDSLQRWREAISPHQLPGDSGLILPLARLHLRDPTTLSVLQRDIQEALSTRRTICLSEPGSSKVAELMFLLVTMVSSLVVVTVTLTTSNTQMGMFYLPWMILTGYEISGNICVTIAFLSSPGLPYLISGVCLLKAISLRWIFVNVVRRQMTDLMEGDNNERKIIRSKLSIKGKIRLGRFFGTYKYN